MKIRYQPRRKIIHYRYKHIHIHIHMHIHIHIHIHIYIHIHIHSKQIGFLKVLCRTMKVPYRTLRFL